MPDPLRGEIWLAALGSGAGHEQSGTRPVLVLSIDKFNAGPADLVMIVPVTSKTAKSRNIPAHIPISPPEGGLKSASVILSDQVRTISKQRFVGVAWGKVSAATMGMVEDAIRILAGL